MNSHLSIKINGKHLALPEDFSLDIDYQNPMFNDSESFSYPAQLPLEGNRFFLHNVEDKRSTLRPVSFEDTKARIYADGLPVFDGRLKTSDGEELTDSLSMNIEGGQSLNDLISDLDCRDIPVKDDILIGEKLGEVEVGVEGDYSIYIEDFGFKEKHPNGWSVFFNQGDHWFQKGKKTFSSKFNPQSLGFSVPLKAATLEGVSNSPYAHEMAFFTSSEVIGNVKSIDTEGKETDSYVRYKPMARESYINVSKPYPEMPYCNARVAYKHYKMADDGTTDTDNTESNPYFVLDADRPQSGICFYVLYFLDCLFEHLGLDWDNSALTQIEDFNRLCFFTAKCSYDEVTLEEREYNDLVGVNQWLLTRGCGAQMSLNDGEEAAVQAVMIPKGTILRDQSTGAVTTHWATQEDAIVERGVNTKIHVKTSYDVLPTSSERIEYIGDWRTSKEGYFLIKDAHIFATTSNSKVTSVKAKYSQMYANAGNWPDESVSTILTSLENQFGIRFFYDAEEKKVTAKLLRDIYQDTSAPKKFLGTVHTMNKISEKITGVRVCYSAESDAKDQRNNLRDSIKDYDTNYDYNDYPDPAGKKGQTGVVKACTTVTDKTYRDICGQASNTDNTCYIDPTTGNAYRVKVNSEASIASELKPAWFEMGAFKGVELGDCSQANEDFVVEIASDFNPLILSDVNAEQVKTGSGQPLLVPYCDEDMEREYIQQGMDYPVTFYDSETDTFANLNATIHATLNLMENYDPSSSEDGNSPLQNYDWGLAVAIMRGGGTDTAIYAFDNNYDGFGNTKWGQSVGDYALTTDSIDQLGNHYDYNGGDQTGLSRGERFSLKIRAFKGELTSWANGNPLCADDEYSATDGWYYIKNRGTFDRFLYEHAYFLLNRRKFIIRCDITAAFLQDIRNHWQERWRINNEIGYINKVSTSITTKEGIGEAEIEFYAI